MKWATVAVCLLVLTTGCIVQTEEKTPETATPSTSERIDKKAEMPKQPETPSAAKYDMETKEIENYLHQKINERRETNSLDSLKRSVKLNAIARYKSWDMAHRDYFAHRGPNGTTHQMMRNNFNSNCEISGQNILKHPHGANAVASYENSQSKWAEETINALMNSTGHRQNILDPDYEVQGIGVFVDENGTVFLTQEFCG